MSGGAAVRGVTASDVQAMIDAGVPVILAVLVQNALGVADVGPIGVGATKPVDVQIKPAMPNTAYSAAASIIGTSTLLGQLEVLSWSIQSASIVRVMVKNNALIALNSGQVLVSAVRD